MPFVVGDDQVATGGACASDLQGVLKVWPIQFEGTVNLLVTHREDGYAIEQRLKCFQRLFVGEVFPQDICDICETKNRCAVPDLRLHSELENLPGIFRPFSFENEVQDHIGVNEYFLHLFRIYASLSSFSKSSLAIFPANIPESLLRVGE